MAKKKKTTPVVKDDSSEKPGAVRMYGWSEAGQMYAIATTERTREK